MLADLERSRVELLVVAPPGRYWLMSGSASVAAARYEVEQARPFVLSLPRGRATLGPMQDNPRYAPSLIVGRWIVRNQTPEYVGAQQKKFAWIIGIVLASVMFALQVVVNSFSPITGLICLICLVFLFFETSFGICIGCKVYSLVYREKAQYCPGEVCDVTARHEIQRTSLAQAVVVLAFVGYVVLVAAMFHENFAQPPYDLFGLTEARADG